MSNITLHLNRPGLAAIDTAHASLIIGSLMSSKAQDILEIGIGTGFVTNLLLTAVEYNRVGHITAIDNFHDLGGNLPKNTLNILYRQSKLNIIAPIEERDFIISTSDNSYDFLISDGDHNNAHQWIDHIFRICKPDAFMFFHDISNQLYPDLIKYKFKADELDKPNFLFKNSSRTDEQCERGLLMVINRK